MINRKRIVSRLLALMLLAVLLFSSVVSSALAAPALRGVDYEGKGRFEVDFRSRIKFKNLKITVKDSSGKKYTAKIVDKDDDDLEFRILNYKPGKTYTFTLSGIRKVGEKKYYTVTGKAKIPAAPKGIPLKEVEYDAKDRELSVEFDAKVEWKNPKLKVSDGKKTFTGIVKSRTLTDIEVVTKKLTPGARYTITLSGIRLKGTEKYRTITFHFMAPKK